MIINLSTSREGVIKALLNNKLFIMGIAIIFIMLYHIPRIIQVSFVFNPCFIGVDIFTRWRN